jgi:hypothetical protein
MRFLWRKSDRARHVAGPPYVGRIRADRYREAAADPVVRALTARAAKKAKAEQRD